MKKEQAIKRKNLSKIVINIKNYANSIYKILGKKRHLISSVGALLGSNITGSLLTAIGGLLIARFLGPEETGPFRAFSIPLTYLMFLGLGTNDGLWRQIPYYIGKEKPEKVKQLASAAGFYMLCMSGIISIGFICCSIYCLYNGNIHGVFGWLSQVFWSWEIFYGSYLNSTYRTLNNFVTLARIQLIKTILTFLMVFTLPFMRFYGLCSRLAIPSVLLVWLFHRNRPIVVRYRFDWKALKEILKIGLPFSVWGTIYTSGWIATENALILYLSNVTALGLFAVGYLLRSAVDSIPNALWQVFTPRVVTAYAQDESIRNANQRIIWVTIGLTVFMIILALVGSFFIDIFASILIPKYVDGIPVMKVCLWFPVNTAAFLPMNTLFATGRSWLYGRSVISGIVVFGFTTYLLLPRIDALLAVVIGSLCGRFARTLAAYVDLIILTRQEKANSRV